MPSIKELRKICQQSEVAPPWLSQSIEGRINRIFSIYFTWIFIRLPFTPNQITIFGTLVYLAGAFMFLFGEQNFYLIGCALIFISFILDACDGELARYRASKSKLRVGGLYVEPVSHDIQYTFFFLPIGLGAYFLSDLIWPLIAAFLATVFKLLFRLLEFRYNSLAQFWAKMENKEYQFSASDKPKGNKIIYFVYRNLFTSTGALFPLIIASIFKRIDIFLYFYAISFFLLWAILFFKKIGLINAKIKQEKKNLAI